MNIIEAMLRSKETGERFRRATWPNGRGWQVCASGFSVDLLGLDDILADDWSVTGDCTTFSRKVTTYLGDE